jgi:hypothetical protein
MSSAGCGDWLEEDFCFWGWQTLPSCLAGHFPQAMKPGLVGGHRYSGSCGGREGRAAAAPRARVTPSAFRGGSLCRVLFPAQGRRGPGNKTRGMTAPVGRRLRAGGVWLVMCGCSVVRAAPTSRGWARPLTLSAAVICGLKHGGHHACLEASASGLTQALEKEPVWRWQKRGVSICLQKQRGSDVTKALGNETCRAEQGRPWLKNK